MNTRSIFRRFDCKIGRHIGVLFISWVLVGGLASAALASEPKQGGALVFGAENEFAGFDLLKARGLAICDAIAMNTIMERLFDSDKAVFE